MLSNADTCLPAVYQALQTFKAVSYYKVNETKWHILNLGIPDMIEHKLKQSFPYTWRKEGIKYLGMTLTPKLEDLMQANYTSFLDTLGAKLNKLASTKLS